jgi:hypothetical protein
MPYYLSTETEDAKGLIDYPYPDADKKNKGYEAHFESLEFASIIQAPS